MSDTAVDAAYRWCQNLARSHYENFPVASHMLPRRLRRPVAAIYAFARLADDLADEGDHDADWRLRELDRMRSAMHGLEMGQVTDQPVYVALHHAIGEFGLPIDPFLDLLSAFRQDVTQTRYADFGALMDYCRRSANPVGRLLLVLYGAADARNTGYSDAICSALQLINFLQDVQQDLTESNRIYIPQDEMERFGITEADIAARDSGPAMERLLQFQAERAGRLLKSGSPLGKVLKGRIGFELRLIILGGSRVLDKLQARREDLFSRPRLTRKDKAHMIWGAIRHGI